MFTELAEGPPDTRTLRGRLGLNRRGACDFLDALVAPGMLDREDDLHRDTAETDRFLDRAKPSRGRPIQRPVVAPPPDGWATEGPGGTGQVRAEQTRTRATPRRLGGYQ